MPPTPEAPLARVMKTLSDWDSSLRDPPSRQRKLLGQLLEGYAKTEYGEIHSAASIDSIEEYRERFPAVRYAEVEPWLKRVRDEDFRVFLYEEPLTWVMTRGTTGRSKVIPVTPRHLQDIIRCGSRAVLNFSIRQGGLELLAGGVLNLQFPSNTETMKIGEREIVYGFSSGTYAKLNPMMAGLSLVPRQEEIDALKTGLTEADWEQRYEYIYQAAKDREIVSIIGVAPVQTGFARYLKKKHGVYPRELWQLKVVYSTSVAKIQTRYVPRLRAMYGDAPVVEMYTATEGAFGQQRDELPYIVPNYDAYLFEVNTGDGVKMLHELRRGEWGRLIVSTSILPRYELGDLVEGMGKNYFRVFGRDRPEVVLEHMLYRALYRWFL
ncbi:GH3 auxin-responsive promoter family protein [Candidatus Bathyarchaeota archaeon]|nr:GH3 auxin-responsive promoter family protein [Candidatus Bathyarchaeota archaeon]